MQEKPEKSAFERIPCRNLDCPERIECCTTVRWHIGERDYHDRDFREWWLLHDGARLIEEDGMFYMQWPMRCRNVADDGLSCREAVYLQDVRVPPHGGG